jgi:hypothetical protein
MYPNHTDIQSVIPKFKEYIPDNLYYYWFNNDSSVNNLISVLYRHINDINTTALYKALRDVVVL